MPTIYICPKNPDSFNQTLVLNDMRKHLGRNWRQMNETRIRQLLEYAIAGAGFHNVEKIVAKFTQEDKARLSRLFRKWVDGRAYETFFKLLFERYAYRCRDVRFVSNYITQSMRYFFKFVVTHSQGRTTVLGMEPVS